jgi:hypothetical protein
MNGMNKKRLGRGTMVMVGALTLIAAGTSSCTDNTTTVPAYAYDDYYLYSAYYPADVAYAGYYWADSWYYPGFYYAAAYGGGSSGGTANGGGNSSGVTGGNGGGVVGGAAGTTGAGGTGGAVSGGGTTGTAGTGGTTGTTTRTALATVIEALARGENVCPGQVTVTEKFATPACAGGTATQERNGVTIAFNGCLTSGQTISGTFDVQSNRSASAQACTSSTVITLGHTTTITNLSIAGPNGKIVIPSHTDTGMTTYTFGQAPTSLNVMTSNGEIQFFNSAGTLVSDLAYNGSDTYTFPGNSSYSVDGTDTVQEKNGSASATVTKMGLTRSNGCCRPTGGSVTIDRTGGNAPGQATWSFGPSCGAVMRNNTGVTLPGCI